jgi:hypothetical protein
MTGADGVRKRSFESVDIWATYEGAIANDRGDGGIDFRLDALILQMKIGVGHGHGWSLISNQQLLRAPN